MRKAYVLSNKRPDADLRPPGLPTHTFTALFMDYNTMYTQSKRFLALRLLNGLASV